MMKLSRAGKRALQSYCEPCFREVMEESEKVAGKYDSDESRQDRDLAKQEEQSSKKKEIHQRRYNEKVSMNTTQPHV